MYLFTTMHSETYVYAKYYVLNKTLFPELGRKDCLLKVVRPKFVTR